MIKNKDIELANVMKALGHPIRLTIVRKIIEKSKCPCGCNPCSCGDHCEGENCKCGCKCGELVDTLPLAQSTISQHLKELKKAGVVNMTGRKGDYTINHAKLNEGIILLQSLLGHTSELNLNTEICHCHRNKN